MIETPRLRLEPLKAEHARLLFESLRDERLYKFIPDDPPATVEVLQERYAFLEAGKSPDERECWLNWVLFLQPEQAPVGTYQATVGESSTCIAYMVFTPYRRRGLAREAGRALIPHLFDNYGTHVLSANIDTRNAPSIRLVASLGFALVQTIPNADFFKGHASHEFRYELTRDKWQSLGSA